MNDIIENKTSVLSKKEKGRRKKLLKRALTVKEGTICSGISSINDWIELQNLLNKEEIDNNNNQISCQIQWKDGFIKTIDASSHRDLLYHLVHNIQRNKKSNNNSKKRKNIDNDDDVILENNTCNWVSIHNGATISNVAIIEITVDSTNTAKVLVEKLQALFKQQQENSRIVLNVPTIWYQSKQRELYSITDALMYKSYHHHNITTTTNTTEEEEDDDDNISTQNNHKRTSNSNKKTKISDDIDDDCINSSTTSTTRDDVNVVISANDIAKKMKSLILSNMQMEREGYPQYDDDNNNNNNEEENNHINNINQNSNISITTTTKPNEISYKDACVIVSKYTVTNSNNKNNNSKNSRNNNNNNINNTKINDYNNENLLSPFVATKHSNNNNNQKSIINVYGLDCEMVETIVGLELARITLCRLLSYNTLTDTVSTERIWDVYVYPKNKVINYLTKYSGITSDILNNDDKNNTVLTIEQVQAALLQTIQSNDIVIGHSLENDLYASRWIHNNVIDTAILFRLPRSGAKLSLRHLAATLLQKQIQNIDKPHCSEEDAVTALELAVHRAIKGSTKFCIYDKNRRYNWLSKVSTDNTVVCIGPSTWLQSHVVSQGGAAHALQCDSVHDSNMKAMNSWLTGPNRRAAVVWTKLCIPSNSVKEISTTEQIIIQQDIEKLENDLNLLLQKLSSRTVLLIAIQMNNLNKVKEMAKIRRVRQNPRTTIPWTEKEEDIWQDISHNAQNGYVLWVSGSSNGGAASK